MTDCRLRIKELYESLTQKEQQVANFVLNFPENVINMPISDLAQFCGVSVSSVVRLCKSIGYSGYKEFCRNLSTDLTVNQQDSATYTDIRPGDSVETLLRGVCLSNMQAIENTMSLLDVPVLEKVVDLISAARRVDFYGVGTSGLVAQDARNKFLRINKVSLPSVDPHDQLLCAATLQPGDVAVVISHTGNTKDVLEAVEVIKQTGATLISVTRFSKNPLAQQADYQLYTASSETMFRSGAMSARIALLAVVDVVYTCVASQNYGDVKASWDRSRLITSKKHMQMNY